MALTPEELAKAARALAQAHPLSPLARRYHDRTVEREGANQPMAEIGIWAGVALLTGYCLRRVEENQAGLVLEPAFSDSERIDDLLESMAGDATRIAGEVRAGTGGHLLVDEALVVAALDRIIASEIDKRLHNWSEDIDDEAWAEAGQYLTWWVVHGYALRVAEMASGAVA
ncbi:MAG TPA: hypothetical protein VFO65_09500 [Acidimicrobiales bacterium]|nr:hypothetical protein [Acidimicrobiales bacterium]